MQLLLEYTFNCGSFFQPGVYAYNCILETLTSLHSATCTQICHVTIAGYLAKSN